MRRSPELQEHLKDPGMFEHVPLHPPLSTSHSSISEIRGEIKQHKVYMQIETWQYQTHFYKMFEFALK